MHNVIRHQLTTVNCDIIMGLQSALTEFQSGVSQERVRVFEHPTITNLLMRASATERPWRCWTLFELAQVCQVIRHFLLRDVVQRLAIDLTHIGNHLRLLLTRAALFSGHISEPTHF